MPIGAPQGNLDIKNATLRTSNLETQNIKIGSIFVGTGNSLEETANVGNSMSNTIQFTNTHTAFTTTGNVSVGKDLTVGTANLFVDTVNSKIGLGTVSPAQSLHVSKVVAGGVNSILVSNPDGNINSSAALKLGVSSEDDTVAKFGIIHERKSPYGGGDTYFCTNYATDTTEVSETDAAITILGQNKQVGIGYTNPSEKLEVDGQIRADHLKLDGTTVVENKSITMTAGSWHELAALNNVPGSGTYLIQVTWGNAYDNTTTRIWSGGTSFTMFIRSGSTGIYNPSPQETIAHFTPTYHHRTHTGWQFMHDSNSGNGSYGYQTIYVKCTQGDLTAPGWKVVAYKIGS